MKDFVSYNKMSKKQKREFDTAKRKTWGELDPTPRISDVKKTYKRSREKRNLSKDIDEKL